MARPKMKIELDTFDRMTEIIGIAALVLLIGLPLVYFSSLPETIPGHYGIHGTPDRFDKKETIWFVTVIGVMLYVGMAVLNRYPHIFNYPTAITEKNAEKQYSLATKMIRILNALMACTFAYLTYATIQTALGRQSGLSHYFMPVSMMLIFGTIGYFLYKLLKNKSS